MKILIHTCCAPCLIHPYQVLKKKNHEITAFFYNPNIHPYTEYKKREDSLKEYTQRNNILAFFYEDYDIENFFRATEEHEGESERCPACWRLRLKKTAQVAREKNFDGFTTTLLSSPYQDQNLLKQIGNDIQEEEGIKFYFEDFKSGFEEAHNKAKKLGVYLQRYCGCLYSERAKYLKKYRKKR
jgi:epoxyqueuosine reductase